MRQWPVSLEGHEAFEGGRAKDTGGVEEQDLEVTQWQRCSHVAKHKTVTAQAPNSADLALADFILFPSMKLTLKCRRFQKIEGIEDTSVRKLRAFP
jgi:hypothetical protein